MNSLNNYESVMKFINERTVHGVNGVYDETEHDIARYRWKKLQEQALRNKTEEETAMKATVWKALQAFAILILFITGASILIIMLCQP